MKWTTNRPTEPGRYWLSLDPEHRQNLPSVFCVLVDRSERGRWSVTSSEREAGFCNVNLEDDLFDGAQWSPRETPADPFAQSAGTWSPRIAVLEKIAGALGYRIEIMPGLDVAGRCHYHRRLIEIGEPDARYAFSVIAHELGHALHGCLVEDVETARTKEQREACATAFASAIGMMA